MNENQIIINTNQITEEKTKRNLRGYRKPNKINKNK